MGNIRVQWLAIVDQRDIARAAARGTTDHRVGLGATMFNLITDLVGGIRVSVLEEEVLVSTVEGDGKRQ